MNYKSRREHGIDDAGKSADSVAPDSVPPNVRPRRVTLSDSGVYAGEIVHAPGFSMENQTDLHHEIFHLLRGTALIHVGDPAQAFPLLPNEYIIVPAGIPHRLEDIRPATLFLLCLSPERLESNSDRYSLWRALTSDRYPFKPDETVSRRIDPLWRSFLAGRPPTDPTEPNQPTTPRERLETWTRVDTILLLLEEARRNPSAISDSRTRVLDFRRHLERTHFERWTVERAARFCGLSIRRFSGLYSELHGRTFIHDLQSIRLVAFENLAASGLHSIPGAAYLVGFEDLSHFYRVFGKEYGEPPGRRLKSRTRNCFSSN